MDEVRYANLLVVLDEDLAVRFRSATYPNNASFERHAVLLDVVESPNGTSPRSARHGYRSIDSVTSSLRGSCRPHESLSSVLDVLGRLRDPRAVVGVRSDAGPAAH